MRILICDDEEKYVFPLKECLEAYMDSHNISYSLKIAANAEEIMAVSDTFDIAFLDVLLEGSNGIALAKELRHRNCKTALFFITNYDCYQDDAMDLRAFRFFKKPFDPDRLYAGLDKAMEYINDVYVDVYLCDKGVQKRLPVDDIIYLTVEGRKVGIQTTNHHFLVRGKLDDWMEQFPQSFFCQVHKSYIVNLHHVNEYAYSELTMSDGNRIPIAAKKQAAFRKIWFEYLGRR